MAVRGHPWIRKVPYRPCVHVLSSSGSLYALRVRRTWVYPNTAVSRSKSKFKGRDFFPSSNLLVPSTKPCIVSIRLSHLSTTAGCQHTPRPYHKVTRRLMGEPDIVRRAGHDGHRTGQRAPHIIHFVSRATHPHAPRACRCCSSTRIIRPLDYHHLHSPCRDRLFHTLSGLLALAPRLALHARTSAPSAASSDRYRLRPLLPPAATASGRHRLRPCGTRTIARSEQQTGGGEEGSHEANREHYGRRRDHLRHPAHHLRHRRRHGRLLGGGRLLGKLL